MLLLLPTACEPAPSTRAEQPAVDSGTDSSGCPSASVGGDLDADGDGLVDPQFSEGSACDGRDGDHFREGVVACRGQIAVCTDPNSEDRGSWSAAFPWPSAEAQTEAVHLVMLPNGWVLSMYHGADLDGDYFPNQFDPAAVWNPTTGEALVTPEAIDADEGNLFCSGHNLLADGRVFFTGGDVTAAVPARGEDFTYGFDGLLDPRTSDYEPWEFLGNMVGGDRWYPTNVTLADGTVLITSGATVLDPYTINESAEVYLPGPGRFELRAPQEFHYMYPWMHLLPDGRVIGSGQEAQAVVWDPVTDVWAPWGEPRAQYREYGTATMLLLDGNDANSAADVLVAGGCEGRESARCCLDDLIIHQFEGDCDLPDPVLGSETWECFSTAELLTGAATNTPAWEPTAPMAYARAHAIATLLPDGNVLISGGESNDCTSPATSELYSTTTRSFGPTAPYMDAYRGDYHTAAVLLPDGRVLVSGGDGDALDTDGPTAMVYSPPYLDLDCCSRPGIVQAPTQLTYGQAFEVTVDRQEVEALVFMRPGASTHDFTMDQRGVRVAATNEVAAGSDWVVEATAPLTPGLAPPGYYMMFALTVDGVPSEAAWVQLTGGECDELDCDTPPAGVCEDATTLRSPVSIGDCFEGSCQYVSESVVCEAPDDAPEGATGFCEAGACDWGCPAGGTVCGDQCCVEIGAGTSQTLAGGDHTYRELIVAGELVFTGSAKLEVESLVIEPGGVVRCEASGETSDGSGGMGDGTGSGAGGGGGAAAGAGGRGGRSGSSSTIGGEPGTAWLSENADCAAGSPGGLGGGGGHGGAGGLGGGLLVIEADVVEIAGTLACAGGAGLPGEFDDGGGGGGSGGCLRVEADTLRVDASALFSVAGGVGGTGGFCAPDVCGAAYCGGGGGGGGGGAAFFECDTCEVDGEGVPGESLAAALASQLSLGGGAGALAGTGSEACEDPALDGASGAAGLSSSDE